MDTLGSVGVCIFDFETGRQILFDSKTNLESREQLRNHIYAESHEDPNVWDVHFHSQSKAETFSGRKFGTQSWDYFDVGELHLWAHFTAKTEGLKETTDQACAGDMQEWKDVKKAAAPGWLNRPSTFTSTTPTAQPQARTVATLADKPHIKQSLGPQRGFILGKVRLPSKQSLDAISPARPFISTLNSSIVRPPPNLSSRIPSTSSKRRDSDTEAEVNNLTDRLPHQTKQTKAKLDTFEKYAEYNHKGEKESTKEIKSEQTKPMTLKRNIDLEDADKDGSEVESQQPKPMELKRKIDLDGYDRDEIEDESVGESDDEGVKKRRIF